MNEQKKMTEMNEWLDEVCAALGVDRGLLAEVTPEVLDLVGRVAHGPSRPGGPLTAMAVGIAAAQGGGGFVAGTETDFVTSRRFSFRHGQDLFDHRIPDLRVERIVPDDVG